MKNKIIKKFKDYSELENFIVNNKNFIVLYSRIIHRIYSSCSEIYKVVVYGVFLKDKNGIEYELELFINTKNFPNYLNFVYSSGKVRELFNKENNFSNIIDTRQKEFYINNTYISDTICCEENNRLNLYITLEFNGVKKVFKIDEIWNHLFNFSKYNKELELLLEIRDEQDNNKKN